MTRGPPYTKAHLLSLLKDISFCVYQEEGKAPRPFTVTNRVLERQAILSPISLNNNNNKQASKQADRAEQAKGAGAGLDTVMHWVPHSAPGWHITRRGVLSPCAAQACPELRFSLEKLYTIMTDRINNPDSKKPKGKGCSDVGIHLYLTACAPQDDHMSLGNSQTETYTPNKGNINTSFPGPCSMECKDCHHKGLGVL